MSTARRATSPLGRATDVRSPSARQLERGQAVDAVQGEGEGEQRQDHAGEHRRQTGPRDHVKAERIQREERGARGGERAQVRPVAVVRDHQVPGGVPAGRGGRQQVAEPPESPGHSRRVEGVANRSKAKGKQRSHTRQPHEQARAPQRQPAVAHRCPARRVDRSKMGQRSGPAAARGAGRRAHARRGLKRGGQLACFVEDGQLGGVGVHVVWAERGRQRCSVSGRKSHSER